MIIDFVGTIHGFTIITIIMHLFILQPKITNSL